MTMLEIVGRVLKVIGGIAVAVGFLIVIGTAGASDLDGIAFSQIKDNLITAAVFFVVGGVLLFATDEID